MEQSHSHDSIKNIININKNFVSVIYKYCRLCEVFDKRSNAKIISENASFIYISALDDEKIVKINGNRIALLNENWEILKEAIYEKPYDLIEVMNENTIIVAKNGIYIADSTNLSFLNFSDGDITCYFSIKSRNRIEAITKIAEDKFAYVCYQN